MRGTHSRNMVRVNPGPSQLRSALGGSADPPDVGFSEGNFLVSGTGPGSAASIRHVAPEWSVSNDPEMEGVR